MEILQFLLSLLSNQSGLSTLKPILQLFSENSFDIKKVLNNLNLEKIAPIISEFMENSNKKSPPTKMRGVGLNPIANIADKEIVYTLNKYFNQPNL